MDSNHNILDLSEYYEDIIDRCPYSNTDVDFESPNHKFAEGLGNYLGKNFGLRQKLEQNSSLHKKLLLDETSLSCLLSVLCTQGPSMLIGSGNDIDKIGHVIDVILIEARIPENHKLYDLFQAAVPSYKRISN